MGLKDFDIIIGTDGRYVIKNGEIVKVVNIRKSPNYDKGDSSKRVWIEYELSDSEKIRVNTNMPMRG